MQITIDRTGAANRAGGPPLGAMPWHAQAGAAVLDRLGSGSGGLSAAEAARRLTGYGPNALPPPPRVHPLLRFARQFDSMLIYALLAAGSIAVLVGHGLDAAVIAAVVLVNAIVGFVQEGRAEQALSAIGRLISPTAQVCRDGRRQQVPVTELVPGDIVLLEAGDRVPADLRLLRGRGLLIDEALLTGESVAAQKHEQAVAATAALGDRSCIAYSGTLVAAGQGAGVVVASGSATELGRIGALLASVEPLTTPLLRQVDRFGRRFAAFVAIAGVLLFAFAVLVRGWAWVDALMAIVAMAVGVIPEGLPAVITITLAVGVRRMAARQAVIRRLPAVETLGATSVICSDKTGTLTRSEMTACRVVGPLHALQADGDGYAPRGELQAAAGVDAAHALADAAPLLRCAVLCNDATLQQRGEAWGVVGDPMEGALLALAAKAGLDAAGLRSAWPRLDEIPFGAEHRFMATLHRGPDDERVAFVKGAPEQLIEMAQPMAPAERERWTAALAEAGAAGQRVLGFAAVRMAAGCGRLDAEAVAGGLSLLGLVGLIDPPRPEARQAIAECRAAGIAVKMITGDHAATATAIARQLGLGDEPRTLTGAAIDAVPDAALAELVDRTDVFARTSPQHKLRIVRALQSRGRVVAMTGDGVNDAPSLKQADVGVAMGIKGTEAAKEAAEMVLLDDDFASIVNAVHEGRTVHDNIRKVIAWTLPTNGGEALGVVVAVLLGITLPMSAAQILWVNLITSVTLGLALAFEPPEPGVMARRPRRPDAPLLSPFMLWRVGLVSVLFAAAVYLLFFHVLGRGDGVDSARTLVVDAIMAMEVAYLFSVRRLGSRSFTLRAARGTPAVWWALGMLAVAQLAFTYLPPMNRWFATRPLAPTDLLLAAAAGIALLLLLELEKTIVRRLRLFDELASDR